MALNTCVSALPLQRRGGEQNQKSWASIGLAPNCIPQMFFPLNHSTYVQEPWLCLVLYIHRHSKHLLAKGGASGLGHSFACMGGLHVQITDEIRMQD